RGCGGGGGGGGWPPPPAPPPATACRQVNVARRKAARRVEPRCVRLLLDAAARVAQDGECSRLGHDERDRRAEGGAREADRQGEYRCDSDDRGPHVTSHGPSLRCRVRVTGRTSRARCPVRFTGQGTAPPPQQRN